MIRRRRKCRWWHLLRGGSQANNYKRFARDFLCMHLTDLDELSEVVRKVHYKLTISIFRYCTLRAPHTQQYISISIFDSAVQDEYTDHFGTFLLGATDRLRWSAIRYYKKYRQWSLQRETTLRSVLFRALDMCYSRTTSQHAFILKQCVKLSLRNTPTQYHHSRAVVLLNTSEGSVFLFVGNRHGPVRVCGFQLILASPSDSFILLESFLHLTTTSILVLPVSMCMHYLQLQTAQNDLAYWHPCLTRSPKFIWLVTIHITRLAAHWNVQL